MTMNVSASLKSCQEIFSGSSISRLANYGLTSVVDIKQIRRANMLWLIGDKKGAKAAFARKVGTDPAYISQILSTKTKADIGNELARSIEEACKLPYGWMDHEHQDENETVDQDVVSDFAWTYKNVSEEGKAFLRGAIEATKAGFIQNKEKQRKGA